MVLEVEIEIEIWNEAKPSQAGQTWNEVRFEMLIVSRAQDPEAWGRVCRIVTVSLEHSQSLQMIHVSCPLKTKKQGLTRFFEKWSHKVLNEIKFLLSASQKHGAECPELRFILLMFHGIHPIEDSEAYKLLRSSIYKRSIIGNETTRLALRSETSWIMANNEISEA